jgi:hypothetical protein
MMSIGIAYSAPARAFRVHQQRTGLRSVELLVIVRFMKLTSIGRRFLVGVASMSFLCGTAAYGGQRGSNEDARVQRASEVKPKVILVEVTGSRIPQRVVIGGQQVNSASPLTIYEADALRRGGASSVTGMLAMDPSITFSRPR